MPQEIEMKFKVARLTATARRLRACGGKYLATVIQDDLYLDTPSRRLLRAGCGLRLRTARLLRRGARRPNLAAMLTYKGPARRRARAKIRGECQTRVADAKAIAEVLAGCGMRPMLRLQKRRASYRLGRCRVELDELPLLGSFVEIEGPSEAAIESVRRRLQLTGPAIRSHYVRLMMAACERAGRGCREITFSRCRSCSRRPR